MHSSTSGRWCNSIGRLTQAIVLIGAAAKDYAIFYLSADLQTASTLHPRATFLAITLRAGRDWFVYDRPS